ncbi:MAG TPA: cyclic nucleotide-binding domain-containing protein [Kofleriaceae bacterium]|jgi:CRP-like cAMP-binding protein|nr:cyclic nucleotide-binding domain-containing protein [Kofleriaceae bacterium]
MSSPRPADLRTIALFRGFNDEELAEIAALFKPASPGAGGVVFEVDEQANAFYLLTAGEVVLERPGDDVYRLRPPALIGELGALTNLRRNSRAVAQPSSELWRLDAKDVQQFFAINQELGVRFLVNLLEMVADKVNRDQKRLADMRQNLVRTQKELKRLREVVLDEVETPLSQPIHDSLEKLITHNRRVNYRVAPPLAVAANLKLDAGPAQVAEVSRTHVSVALPDGASLPANGAWLSGVLDCAGTDVPISGKVIRVSDRKVTLELDLLIDEYAAAFEGYLTRVQLLDILV